jgi:hypothetical protein
MATCRATRKTPFATPRRLRLYWPRTGAPELLRSPKQAEREKRPRTLACTPLLSAPVITDNRLAGMPSHDVFLPSLQQRSPVASTNDNAPAALAQQRRVHLVAIRCRTSSTLALLLPGQENILLQQRPNPDLAPSCLELQSRASRY